ncbi:2-haloacid dehalogenase [Myriangium duriaei CBS 260.36]|uniref:2-haloacid dehalogenase n=1 Tax=Myriangium duriaei CBS 260.36 TaxID=1168546 RepID=A0A9P4IZ60_9PEZI|nr:2-haloacid dehalogenase [Myriangium duriaei CBS 260.36]
MATHKLNADTKGLTFDIFGTCVDWRSSVTKQLVAASRKAVDSSPSSPAKTKASHLIEQDWANIAAEWRATYYKFTRELASNPHAKFKTVDEHHHDALIDILATHGLEGLWDEAELQHLAFAWHRLDSWSDTNEGLKILGKHFATCTLSNGNVSLLKDMQQHSGMVFTHTFSGEMFGTYKPNPKVYLGAAEKLGVRPDQVVMVAAHIGDLKAAKSCGMQTIFVERPQEEFGDLEQAKREGYVDLWIGVSENGFLGVTKALGLA